MTPNTYDAGDLITLTGRFYSDAALTTPANPSTVAVTIKDPVGAVTTPSPGSSQVGVWTASFTPTVAGMHEVRWVGTGTVQAADQSEFFVRKVNTA